MKELRISISVYTHQVRYFLSLSRVDLIPFVSSKHSTVFIITSLMKDVVKIARSGAFFLKQKNRFGYFHPYLSALKSDTSAYK